MKGFFIFAAGLVAGAVAGAYLVKDKVMADAREEINEVREYYKSKKEDKQEEPVEDKTVEAECDDTEKEYEEIVVNSGYTNYNKPEKIEQQTMMNDMPYIIEPEDFGEEEGYDTMTLTFFADGVLVDDVEDVIEDPDPVVGLENLKVFAEYGANSVYVRNDIWKTDFEILKDDWNWSDVQDPVPEKKPHQL